MQLCTYLVCRFGAPSVPLMVLLTLASLYPKILDLTSSSDIGSAAPLTVNPPLFMTHGVSTVSISTEYKKPIPKDLRWALLRTNTNVVHNGRYDIDVFVFGMDGDVLAIGRHVCYARPFKDHGKLQGDEAKFRPSLKA